jgi:hypothetical protein
MFFYSCSGDAGMLLPLAVFSGWRHLAVLAQSYANHATVLQSCSLTSTGLYKEIAKFGKAAAQPFKQVSVQLNDTFANLGSLSAVAPKLGVIGVNGANGSPRIAATNGGAGGQLRQHTPLRLGRLQSAVRRSQTGGKHDAAAGHHADDDPEGFAEVITQLQALQGSIKESSGLLRIDLQQHTALQV